MADEPHPHDDADEDPRSTADRDKTPLGAAVAQAQRTLIDAVAAADGRVLCAIVLVHADGIEPSGAAEVYADEDGGPQSADDVLTFALEGIGAYAQRMGLPFAVLPGDVGMIGGQG